MTMFASIWDVPIINNLLSSDNANVDISGEMAVNLCSSGLKNDYETLHCAFGSSLSDKNTISEPAL